MLRKLFPYLCAVLFIGCVSVQPSRPDPCAGVPPVRGTAHVPVPGFLRQRPNAKKVLIFVHGLQGDPQGTWTNPNGTYWPSLVEADAAFIEWDIYVYAYPSGFLRECHTVPDAAGEMRTRLRDLAERYDTIAFVAHSQGGLIVRQTLLTYGGPLADKTAALVFFGTPTGGSELADRASFLTHCVDDLRTIGSNAFLKQQNNEWQEKDLRRHITTTCGIEYDEHVVREASGRLLCDDPEQIDANHSGLVKPACANDHIHLLLQRALEAIPRPASTPSQQKPSSALDPDVLQRAQEEQASIRERDVLRFWDSIHSGETVYDDEAKSIAAITAKPAETRLAILKHVFENYEAAQRYKVRHRAIVRAAIGMDVILRDRVRTEILEPLAGTPSPWVRDAVRATSDDLEVPPPVAIPTAPAQLEHERKPIFPDLSKWPQLSAALDALGMAPSAEERRNAFARVEAAFAKLPPATQKQFRIRFTEAILSAPYYGMANFCPVVELVGVRDAIAQRVLADLDEDGTSPVSALAVPGCVSATDAKRILDKARTTSPPWFYDNLVRNYIVFAPTNNAQATLSASLDDLKSPQKLTRDRAVGLLTGLPFLRPEIVDPKKIAELIQDPYACDAVRHLDDRQGGILILTAEALRGRDALAYWQSLVRCRTRSSLDSSYFVTIATLVTSQVPPIHHRSIFFQLMESLWYTISQSLSPTQQQQLRSLIAQRPDDQLHDVRTWFLRSVATPITALQSQIAALLSERIPDVTADEMTELHRIAARCTAMTTPTIAFFRAFAAAPLDRDALALAFADPPPPPWGIVTVREKESARERRNRLARELASSFERESSAAIEATAAELYDETDEAMLARVDRMIRQPFRSEADENARTIFCLASKRALRARLRAAVIEELASEPEYAATPLRFSMATGCDSTDSYRSAVVERLQQLLTSTRSPTVMRSAALALSYCPHSIAVTADVVNQWKIVLSTVATPSDGRRMLDVATALRLDLNDVTERFWERLDAVIGDADRMGQLEMLDVAKALPYPPKDRLYHLLLFPFLPSNLEQVLLQDLTAVSGRPITTFWQAAEEQTVRSAQPR